MRWAFWVAFEWCLVALALSLPALSWWLLPVSLLLLGSRQHALAVLGHEVTHRSAGVPDWVGNVLVFWPLGVSVASYRAFHLTHHVYLNRDADPELRMKARFAARWRDLTSRRKAVLLLRDLVGMNADEPAAFIQTIRGRWSARRVLHAAAFLTLLVAVSGGLGLLLWGGALLTSFWACARARAWREHCNGGTDVFVARLWERAIYLPHYTWKHAPHHVNGRWNVPCWDL